MGAGYGLITGFDEYFVRPLFALAIMVTLTVKAHPALFEGEGREGGGGGVSQKMSTVIPVYS